jgi:undecaprenyl-diphosphatase
MNHAVHRGRSEVSPAQLRRITLLALSLGSWILFYWLGESARADVRQEFDNYLRAAIHAWAQPALTWLMLGATQLGSGYVLSIVSVGTVIALVYRKWYRLAVLLLLNMLAVPWFTEYLKMSFHRMRPEPYFGVPLPASYSFPSGHAFSSFCCYGMIVALLTARLQSHRARVALWLAGAVLILMVGLSRIYLGVHYPSDVVGGWAAALAWISFVLLFDKKHGPAGQED